MGPKRTAKPKLGRLEKIDPADYWQGGVDLQQWLREADNLELLSEAIGLPLEPTTVNATEDWGWFTVVDSAQRVLVMAQVNPSDDSRLGALVSQAATGATRVVWIAPGFSDRHRHSLAWLTQLSQPQVHWLGVTVELWRIGKAAMAVNFASLMEISGTDLEPGVDNAPEPDLIPPEPLTPQQQQNLNFWTGLCQHLDRMGSLVKAGSPSAEASMGFAIARAGFRLNAILDYDHSSLYTELLLAGVDAHPHFYLLAEDREAIADALGLPLIWDDSGDQSCVIATTLPKVDLDDHQRWPDYQNWLCDCLERFYEVFFDRIKGLDANGYSPQTRRPPAPLRDVLVLPASQRL
jgi:hypothetical protein